MYVGVYYILPVGSLQYNVYPPLTETQCNWDTNMGLFPANPSYPLKEHLCQEAYIFSVIQNQGD